MAVYRLLYFGEIELDSPDETYETVIEYNGKAVHAEMTFEGDKVRASDLKKVELLLSNLKEFDEKCRQYIDRDYRDSDGETVKLYIEHHLQEISKSDLSKVIDFSDSGTSIEKQMLDKLRMLRVSLYPDSEDQFATFDYTLGEEITDYLIVIETDAKGGLEYMTMES